MKSLFLLFAAVTTVVAFDDEIRSVRITADGERIFFLTDMRLAGSGLPFRGRIFTSTVTRPETLAEFPLAASAAQQPFNVLRFDISSNADRIAYTGLPVCDSQQAECAIPAEEQSVVQTRDGRVLWRGLASSISLSPDGRFALAAQSAGIFRIDLSTGSRDLLAPGLPRANLAIGGNGAALIPIGRQVAYVTATQRQLLPASSGFLTADGNAVVYRPDGAQRYVLRDMGTQTITELPGTPFDVNGDGSRILYIAQSNHFLLDRRTGETCPLPPDPAPGASQFNLAPDGRSVYIAGVFGIHRTACGAPLTSLIWAPVSASIPRGVVVPGSLARIIVNPVFTSLSADAEFPLRDELAGFRVKLGDRYLPVERIRPYGSVRSALEIRAQVPWDFVSSGPEVPIDVDTPQKSPFESRTNLSNLGRIMAQSPQFLLTDDLALEAVRAGTLTPITRDNPARPGETVHVFLTGLGPVDRAVSTGLPAPDDPPARPSSPIQCQEFDASGIVLAPGRAGVYRWTIALPASRPENFIGLQCGEAFAALPFRNSGQ